MKNLGRTSSNKVKFIQESLLSWFKTGGRKFPWRESNLTEYQLIIAETLLQRTKAETVSRFFNDFITEFPNWPALAQADLEQLEAYLRPIGLFKQRAKRLNSLANEMVLRQGVLPINRAELESIPFFGQYISNAIELIILGRPVPLIDVNMARVLERLFGERKMADIRYDPYLQGLAHEVVNISGARDLNWAILDFAALICKARKPLCQQCFLNTQCNYYLEKNVMGSNTI